MPKKEENVHPFLAPEQLGRHASAARHASVDSYGFGMLLLFLASGKDPEQKEHRFAGWEKSVINRIQQRLRCRWRSLPNRISNLIINCTRDQPDARWTMAQIIAELNRLTVAESTPGLVDAGELLAEEIVVRSALGGSYSNPAPGSFAATVGGGVQIAVAASARGDFIELNLNWLPDDSEVRKNVGKYVSRSTDEVEAALRKAGWSPQVRARSKGNVSVQASCSTLYARDNLGIIVQALDAAVEAVRA